MDRINKICSLIDECNLFADVGCDHGYCAEYALKNGVCKEAVISDVSAKSLSKAERLLSGYIKSGKCTSVCCDGLQKIPPHADLVLIAGMGGNEIVKILKQGFIPQRFILQPMKSAPLLRQFLIDSGCKLTVDDIFKDDKYYFIIKGERQGGTLPYSAAQLQFGRDSLINPLFSEYAHEEIAKKLSYVQNCKDEYSAPKLKEEIKLLEDLLK